MVAVAIVRPNGELSIYNFQRTYKFSQGLDLQGGIHLKYLLDLSQVPQSDQAEAIRGVKHVMENRINPLGIAEPVIQTSRVGDRTALIIELPGQKDTQAAVESIGKIAKLTFRELGENGEFVETGLSGADLRPNGSTVVYDEITRRPIITLNFTSEGAQKFEAITARNIDQPLAIYIDEQIMQVANVEQAISGGEAQINGSFTLEEAQETVRLLNAGALPVPLELVEQRAIGATLGQESVQRSLIAGIVGFALIGLFMILYYRMLGLIAVASLFLYVLISLALFKLMPVTLTLAGITGFILSVGMAVDANILIFERLKEELRQGKSYHRAIKEGFDRAWSSIRDSNASSILTALILYNFGSSSLIKGFSLTLIIGILVSLFTAITVSRSLLYLILGTELFPVKEESETKNVRSTPMIPQTQKRSARW